MYDGFFKKRYRKWRCRAQASEGSTLIEMMLALFIFSIFISISIGGFSQSLTTQRLVLKLTASTDNVSLALEQMMREMRVGYGYATVPGNPSSISFIRSTIDDAGQPIQQEITYYLDANTSMLRRQTKDLTNNTVPEDAPITANNVVVSYFRVTSVSPPNGTGGSVPSLATIVIGVSVSDQNQTSTNYLQTSVATRLW